MDPLFFIKRTFYSQSVPNERPTVDIFYYKDFMRDSSGRRDRFIELQLSCPPHRVHCILVLATDPFGLEWKS